MSRVLRFAAASMLAVLFYTSISCAADKVWTGAGTSRLWSEGANWRDGTAPATGDRIFFPTDTALQDHAQNDIVGAMFDSLWFSGDGNGFLIYGQPLILTGSPTITGQGRNVFFVDIGITFTSQSVRIATTGLVYPDRTPSIDFAPGIVLIFSGGTVEVSNPTGSVSFESFIFESAPTSFDITGTDVGFSGDNSFTGSVNTSARRFWIASAHGMGTPSLGTTISGQSVMEISGSFSSTQELVIPENFTLASDFTDPVWGSVVATGLAPMRLTGSIALLKPQVFMVDFGSLTLDGPVSGPGHLEVGRGDNVLVLRNPANSFTGGVSVSQGVLRLGGSEVIPDSNDVYVGAAGALDLASAAETIGAFSCFGRLKTALGSGRLHVTGALTAPDCFLDLAVPAGFVPRSRQVITVLQNDSGTGFGMPFVGYPEGTVVNVNGVNATATYLAGAGSDFAFIADALPVANAVATSGSLQSAALGAAVAGAFVAQGFDAWNRPAPQARITFSAAPGCGSFGGSSSVQVLTDSQGFATAPAFTASGQSQACFVLAQGELAGSVASFEVHSYSPADVVLSGVPASLSTLVQQGFMVVVELRTSGGMSLPGLAIAFEAVSRGNSGVTRLDPSAITDATSRAIAGAVANDKSGNYDIVARFGAAGVTIPVSQKAR